MVASQRLRPVLGFAVAAIALAGTVVATPSAGASSRSSTAWTATTLTVLLKAPHPAQLSRLATAQGLSHDQRVKALSALLPSAAAHRRVVAELRSRGLTVTHETAWTIDAKAPTGRVATVFGTPSTTGSGAKAAGARAGAALPRVPSTIKSVTAAVLETGTGPAVVQPRDLCTHGCRDGSDFRNAYSSKSHVVHRGKDTNGALTVATLQFPHQGGWNESDLTNYAAAVGLPDPVASGQYTQVPVDGVVVRDATVQEGGADEEVDLDQETILSTAPLANQRAYFDSDANKAGYADALSQVLADVTQGTGAVNGGDPKIAALSTSWGACEAKFSSGQAFAHDTIKAVNNILKSLTAAGVTVFAASGDDGIYDCGFPPSSTRTAVDFPASSPYVVGVGGTRLRPKGSHAANNGHNWADTSWTCTSAEVCQGFKRRDTGGSGGGESKRFALPKYQAVGIGHDPFRTSTGKKGSFGAQPRRLVPDIAGDGDPATGFKILTSDPYDVKSCSISDLPPCKPKFFAVGGTSLSAPAAAALFTDMLAEHNATAGVGDIHNALYSAYAAHPNVFRDVKAGRNGRQKDLDRHTKGKASRGEIPVTAEKGYDTVTGLGAPLWPALAPYIFEPATPKATARLQALPRHGNVHAGQVRAQWGTKALSKAGILAESATVTIRRQGKSAPVYHRTSAPATGSHSFTGKPGATYVLTVVLTDLAGNRSKPFTIRRTVRSNDT
jgi:kumamolisin